jgi:pyruvate/2-oxoglutarate dehydrogenase complex dihydrolipoamide dehydrogenase (E3) component
MPEEITPDLCVIGGGPGGVALAAGAANRGLAVVLVERERLGGANLSEGGVPARALSAAAELNDTLRRGPAMGVSGAPLQVNLAKVQEHVRSVVEAAGRSVSAERLAALGVRVITAEGRFADRRTLVAGEAAIRARHFAIATGSVPLAPDIAGLDSVEPLSLAAAVGVSREPTHLIVLGAGPRGLELAQAYSRLGIDATVIDSRKALDGEDPELTEPVLNRLRAEGIRIRDGAAITAIQKRKGGIRVSLVQGEEEIVVDGSHLLIVAGRVPNIAGLGLDAAGIAHSAEGISVDRRLRTTNRHVYALGDVVAGPASVARAEHHAGLVLAAINGGRSRGSDEAAVPFVVFTDPALARVGLGEAEARQRHKRLRILRLPFIENDLAQAERTSAGMIKVVASDRGQILGAAAAGRGAGEVIALWSLAIAGGLDIGAMAAFAAPYPSRAEIARRVALAFDGPGPATAPRRGLPGLLRRLS